MTTQLAYRQPSTRFSRNVVGAQALATRVPHDHHDLIAASPVDSLATRLERIGSTVAYPSGKTVIEAGDAAISVYKVVAGVLRSVRLLPDGRRHIARFLLPGDFFGFSDADTNSHAVEAIADVTLTRFPRRAFESLLEADGGARRCFYTLVCGELSAVQEHMLLLGRKTALERMASFLLHLADREMAPSDHEAGDAMLPMSRVDIGDYLGLTIETVSRLLSQLKRDKIIALPRPNRVVFLDRDALEEIAAGTAMV
jgi:CRP-like cAMP-binding protein